MPGSKVETNFLQVGASRKRANSSSPTPTTSSSFLNRIGSSRFNRHHHNEEFNSLSSYDLHSTSTRKKSLIERILPMQFSEDSDHSQDSKSLVQQQKLKDPTLVRLNVYRINDMIGFYHTGIVFGDREFTFCQGTGICQHSPTRVDFATFLGSIRLGKTDVNEGQFEQLLEVMKANGFSIDDYDIMSNSCNTFTEEIAKKLHLVERYPTGVLNQSKLGDFLSPLARALDLVPDHGPTSKLKRSLVNVPSASLYIVK